eukprot:6039174-Prymnesium_polylepis.1
MLKSGAAAGRAGRWRCHCGGLAWRVRAWRLRAPVPVESCPSGGRGAGHLGNDAKCEKPRTEKSEEDPRAPRLLGGL